MIYAQPSVTKVGGIMENLRVVALADAVDVKLMLHSPYSALAPSRRCNSSWLRDDGTFVSRADS